MTTTVAGVIQSQIGVWTFAQVGASDLMRDGDNALTFKARLHKVGQERAYVMRVTVTLEPSDTYTLTVVRGDRWGAPLERWQWSDVYCDQLAPLIKGFDLEGLTADPAVFEVCPD
jgi:hypothetical protein